MSNRKSKKRTVKLSLDYPGAYHEKKQVEFGLDTYQISKIPLRKLTWFDNEKFHRSTLVILAYSLNDDRACSYISVRSLSHAAHLISCQKEGYRLIEFGELEVYREIDPVCDRCVFKNGCNYKKNKFLLIYDPAYGFYSACGYTPLKNIPVKIDVDLIAGLSNLDYR